MEAKDYTQDGTVNLHGHPVLASQTGKWKACSFLVGIVMNEVTQLFIRIGVTAQTQLAILVTLQSYEAFERMAFYGIASNLVVYLTTKLHEDTVSSVRNVNNWSGSVWMTPILGAYLADSYLGRFWTFTLSSLIYVMGMVLLTMAVSIQSLQPTCANGVCSKASPSQTAFLYSALYIIAVGAGGTKPNISTFGADQFDDYNPHERTLKASFFNWWMFSSFIGALMATLVLVYIQENLGWGLGYGIPTVGLILSLFIFYVGTPTYRHKVRKTNNPAGDLFKVATAAFANRKLRVPTHPSDLHEFEQQHYTDTGKRQVRHTPIFKFLDKAAIKEENPSTASKTLCTVTQVEGAKLVLGMLMIWLVTLIPSTIWAQINTLFVKQGTTLDSRLGTTFQIPPASLSSFVTLSMLLSVPIYDRYFVPFMRKKTGNPRGITLLQRLGIGFVIQILAIAIAYAVEVKRMNVLKVNQTGPKEIVPMSIFWLLPQYVLLGIADVFNCVGLLEFFYDQSPEDMQSLGTTFFTSGIGVGNFLNSFLVTVVDEITGRGGHKSWIGRNLNDSHLDYYYGFLLVMSALNLGAFLWASSVYEYKRESTEVEGYVEMEGKTIDICPLGLQV